MDNLQCLPVGSVIPGTTYKVVQVLGQGNFGITYKVYDTVLEDTYALKEFFPRNLTDCNSSVSLVLGAPNRKAEKFETLKKKFISEAKSLRACHHPGIVNIQMVIPSVDTVYILMDFIEGETLAQKYIGKPLDPEAAVAIIKKIAEPLKHLHDRNIVHFDLSPNNVMVRPDDSIVLIDFGFAKQYDQSGEQMCALPVSGGTIGYIAPEQIEGKIKDFTPSTDTYALGGILCFLLTGHAPVSCQTLLRDDGALCKGLPEKFHDFIKKAMAIRVKDRFASVDEFIAGLPKTNTKETTSGNENDINRAIDGLNSISNSKRVFKPIPREDKKWNFVDAEGHYLAKQWFDGVHDFSEDWARVWLNGKWNFINSFGKYLSNQWFDVARPFSEGWALINLNGKWNFINPSGEYLSFRWFDEARDFSKGCAAVKSWKWTLISSSGKLFTDPKFDYVWDVFEGWVLVEMDERYNFINSCGQYISDQWFYHARPFSEGWALIEKLNGKHNFINTSGRYISESGFDDACDFSEGWAAVKLKGKCNFIDLSGKYLSDIWYDRAMSFSEGWAPVALKNRKWNLLNRAVNWNFICPSGKYLSDQWFDDVSPFINGKSMVQLKGMFNYMTLSGEYLYNQWLVKGNEYYHIRMSSGTIKHMI